VFEHLEREREREREREKLGKLLVVVGDFVRLSELRV
jgi:hypothetical protein